ncbi:MAG: hypothetical protein GC158_06170 [Cyanobacteria bacterium RI_101]|nr:hypothetical protein [Cyanobacteria bacterium RI_101]
MNLLTSLLRPAIAEAVPTPMGFTDTVSVSLSLSSGNVLEDGDSNLVYTFARTGSLANALTVKYKISGTATIADYAGATPGGYKTLVFAPGSSVSTLTLDPRADAIVEKDDTISLSLLRGAGYTIQTMGAVTGTILNDDNADIELDQLARPNLPPGSPFRYVIVTSEVRPGYQAGIQTYNRFVNAVAKDEDSLVRNVAGNWKAIASYHGANAIDNTKTNWATQADLEGLPLYRIDGVKVADSYRDLWDGSLDAPINLTEKGYFLPENTLVWTGTNAIGMGGDNIDIITRKKHWIGKKNVPGGAQANLIGSGLADVGVSSAVDYQWVNSFTATAYPATMENPLYAVSSVQFA